MTLKEALYELSKSGKWNNQITKGELFDALGRVNE